MSIGLGIPGIIVLIGVIFICCGIIFTLLPDISEKSEQEDKENKENEENKDIDLVELHKPSDEKPYHKVDNEAV